MPDIVGQESFPGNGQRVTRFTLSVDAVNDLIARQKARAYLRSQFPTAKNVFSPEVKEKNMIQSTFNDIVPESIEIEEHIVEMVVVE